MKYPLLALILIIGIVGTVSADQMIFKTLTTNDGHANRYVSSGAAFTTIRSGAGTAISTTIPMHVRLTARSSGSTFTNLSRAGIQFDTSTLPDNAVISSAVVSVYGTSKANTFATAPSFALVSFTPATNGTMVAADYNKGGTTTLSNAIAYASISTTAYNNFTVSDLSTISTTSWTRYMIKSSWDYTGTGPTWGASYNMLVAFNSNESSAYKPLLTVTYTVPVQDTTPPASITGLNNDTTGVTTINWSWQNPIDQDFNGTMVYQNDTFLKNVSKETTNENWSGLTEGTQYTISTRTFDLTGNVNQTWVNKTETTLYSGDSPVDVIIYTGSTTITDKLVYATDPSIRSQIISEEMYTALVASMPAPKGGESATIEYTDEYGQSIIIKKVDLVTDDAKVGYWVAATRNGQEVHTHSPIWVVNSPYEVTESESYNPRTNERVVALREDPLEAAKQVISGYVSRQPLGEAVGDDVLIVYPIADAADGLLGRAATGTFPALRAGAGDTVNTAVNTATSVVRLAGAASSQYSGMRRFGASFNTSSIGSGNTTSSAIARFHTSTQVAYFQLGISNIGITNFSPTNPASLVAGDYAKFGSVRYAPDVPFSAFNTTNVDANFTFSETGLLAINRTGITSVMLRSAWDIDNDTTGLVWGNGLVTSNFLYDSGQAGSYDPFLEITYGPSTTAPVSSFTLQKPLLRIPMTLQVNDTSTNTPTGWNWSWGDGTWTNGTTQNATHKYTTRGLKSILLVTSNAGGSNTTPTASTVRIVGYENYW